MSGQFDFIDIVSLLIKSISRHCTGSQSLTPKTSQNGRQRLIFTGLNLEQDQAHGGTLLLTGEREKGGEIGERERKER